MSSVHEPHAAYGQPGDRLRRAGRRWFGAGFSAAGDRGPARDRRRRDERQQHDPRASTPATGHAPTSARVCARSHALSVPRICPSPGSTRGSLPRPSRDDSVVSVAYVARPPGPPGGRALRRRDAHVSGSRRPIVAHGPHVGVPFGGSVAYLDRPAHRLDLKLVYWGPARGGKTTSLRSLHGSFTPGDRGEMQSVETADEQTYFFDYAPLELPRYRDLQIRVHAYTVPGQEVYVETRRRILRGADGVLFVADATPAAAEANLVAWRQPTEELARLDLGRRPHPVVVTVNKLDLPGARAVTDVVASLTGAVPTRGIVDMVGTSALLGRGVGQSFRRALVAAAAHALADESTAGAVDRAQRVPRRARRAPRARRRRRAGGRPPDDAAVGRRDATAGPRRRGARGRARRRAADERPRPARARPPSATGALEAPARDRPPLPRGHGPRRARARRPRRPRAGPRRHRGLDGAPGRGRRGARVRRAGQGPRRRGALPVRARARAGRRRRGVGPVRVPGGRGPLGRPRRPARRPLDVLDRRRPARLAPRARHDRARPVRRRGVGLRAGGCVRRAHARAPHRERPPPGDERPPRAAGRGADPRPAARARLARGPRPRADGRASRPPNTPPTPSAASSTSSGPRASSASRRAWRTSSTTRSGPRAPTSTSPRRRSRPCSRRSTPTRARRSAPPSTPWWTRRASSQGHRQPHVALRRRHGGAPRGRAHAARAGRPRGDRRPRARARGGRGAGARRTRTRRLRRAAGGVLAVDLPPARRRRPRPRGRRPRAGGTGRRRAAGDVRVRRAARRARHHGARARCGPRSNARAGCCGPARAARAPRSCWCCRARSARCARRRHGRGVR